MDVLEWTWASHNH